jgi:hypothetical protein
MADFTDFFENYILKNFFTTYFKLNDNIFIYKR